MFSANTLLYLILRYTYSVILSIFLQDEFLNEVIAKYCPNLKKLTLKLPNDYGRNVKRLTEEGFVSFFENTLAKDKIGSLDIMDIPTKKDICSVGIRSLLYLSKLPKVENLSINYVQLKSCEAFRNTEIFGANKILKQIKNLYIYLGFQAVVSDVFSNTDWLFPEVINLKIDHNTRFLNTVKLPHWEESVKSLECKIVNPEELRHVFNTFLSLETLRISRFPNSKYLFMEIEKFSPRNLKSITFLHIDCSGNSFNNFKDIDYWISKFPEEIHFKLIVKNLVCENLLTKFIISECKRSNVSIEVNYSVYSRYSPFNNKHDSDYESDDYD